MSTFAPKKGITNQRQDEQKSMAAKNYLLFIFSLCVLVCVFILAFFFFIPSLLGSFVLFQFLFSFLFAVQIDQNRCSSSLSHKNVICKARAKVEGSVKEKAKTLHLK